ncbi:MAG: DUF1540 domain-containing protein [Christensenellales bacterium]
MSVFCDVKSCCHNNGNKRCKLKEIMVSSDKKDKHFCRCYNCESARIK